MKHPLLFIYLLIISVLPIHAEHSIADSLRHALHSATVDTQSVRILTALSWELKNSVPEKAESHIWEAIHLADSIQFNEGLGPAYKTLAVIKWYQSELPTCQAYLDTALVYFQLTHNLEGEADVYSNLGLSFHVSGEYGKANEYYTKALKIRLTINDMEGLQVTYNNLGILYKDTGLLEKSLEYYMEALFLSQRKSKMKQLTELYANIGEVYFELEEYESAIENYENALVLFEKQNDIRGMAYTYIGIGEVKLNQGHLEEALNNYFSSLQLCDSLGDKIGIAENHRKIGEVYIQQGKYQAAISQFEESLVISHIINDKVGKIESYNYLGTINIRLNRPGIAISLLQKSVNLAEKSKNLDALRDALKSLSEAYYATQNLERAYESKAAYSNVIHELFNQEKAQSLSRLQTLYEFDQQEREIKELTIQQELNAAKLREDQLKIYVLLFVAIIIAIFLIVLYRNYLSKKKNNEILYIRSEQISRQKEQIENQNTELAEKNHRLKDLNEEKNYLMGVVAHDLKNPLSQIKGLVGIIQQEKDHLTDTQQKFLGMIEGSVDRLTNMIHRILDVKAVESATLNLDLEKINIIHLLDETVNEYELRAKKKSINLHFPDLQEHFMVKVDQEYTRQVFDNLISNALKFSPKERNIYVDIIEHGKQKVKVGIRDEGPGISEEDQKKLFGKYQKLSARPTDGESSSGLGLSIVKKYVEAMDGKAWCESELGKGTIFWVEFFIEERIPANDLTLVH